MLIWKKGSKLTLGPNFHEILNLKPQFDFYPNSQKGSKGKKKQIPRNPNMECHRMAPGAIPRPEQMDPGGG